MAYEVRYFCEFLSAQDDEYQIKILQKDYIGNIYTLQGAADVFITKNADVDSPISAIRAKECEFNFFADSIVDLTNFYSEDDEEFRIDFYCHSVNGVVLDKLLNSFFIVQDNCEEDFTDPPFQVRLSGTDNLALLKDVPFTSVGQTYDPTDGTEYLGKISLFDYIKIAVQQTGLGDLPIRIYSNIYENTIDDRGQSPEKDMFKEIFLYTGEFLNTDGTWADLYSIIEKILTRSNCSLFQDAGAWNIVRYQEVLYFTENRIVGTETDSNGIETVLELAADWNIVFGSERAFDNADQLRRIQRPFKFAKETFNYVQPILIDHQNLLINPLATPYQTSTVSGRRYDRYSLATYFPTWLQTHGDTSYLEVVTDITVVPEAEVDRYIVTPGVVNSQQGVQFRPIEVSAGDSMGFTLRYKMLTANNDGLRFWIRFELITAGGDYYHLNDPIGGGFLLWDGPHPVAFWDVGFGFYWEIAAGDPKTEWTDFDFSRIAGATLKDPKFPVDGMLLIEVRGTNGTNNSNRQQTVWKDISLTIVNYINDSVSVIGQAHNNEQTAIIKNNYDEQIFIDDSPRNTIGGTLFTDLLTNFEADIGDVYFTKTAAWHRLQFNENLRLGQLITAERMALAFTPRTIIEGSLKGLRKQLINQDYIFISLLNVLQIDSLPSLNFIIGRLEINWSDATYKAVLNELHTFAEVANYLTYTFNYLYETK